VKTVLRAIRDRLAGFWPARGTQPQPTGPAEIRLHLPRCLRESLAAQTVPRVACPEPLALLRLRYAGEERRDVIVAVGVLPFAEEAYVEGDAGANFDTRWLIARANDELFTNCGLMLVHSHGGRGTPDFSWTDRRTNHDVMAPLAIGVATAPYGAMVLSTDGQYAVVTTSAGLAPATVIIVPDATTRLDLSA